MMLIATAIFVIMFAAPATAASWVPVSIDSAGAIVVYVHINDNGPFPFLLDTGASHSVISNSLAERLTLRPVARTTVMTSTGGETRPVVRLDRSSIGSARSENIFASVTPAAHLASITRGIEGIIGQDFLNSLNYTLDYRRRRLIWEDVAPCDARAHVPLVRRHGRYLAQIPVAGSDISISLVPDSGANGFVMFERGGRTRTPLDPAAQITAVHSLSGRQDVRTMRLRELRIGEVIVRDELVAVIASDGDARLEGDGLLPLHLFASVSFNAREQCLIVRR